MSCALLCGRGISSGYLISVRRRTELSQLSGSVVRSCVRVLLRLPTVTCSHVQRGLSTSRHERLERGYAYSDPNRGAVSLPSVLTRLRNDLRKVLIAVTTLMVTTRQANASRFHRRAP